MLLALKNLLFTLVVPGTVAVYVPWLVTHGRGAGARGSLLISSVLWAVGGTIYLWCLWDFASFGRGTPAPIDAPKKLVIRGLYRYTRNPMYVGVLTTISGWAARFPSMPIASYLLGVGTTVHLFVVFYEEPHLRREFGTPYELYCQRVRRWLPRSRPGRRPSDRR